MTYTKKVAYNTFAQMIGKVVGIAVSLVTTAILFRYFGVEGIGKYTTAFAFVAFFAVFADLGLQWTLIRELTVDSDHNKVFKNIFAFRLLLAIFVHALAFSLVWFFKYPLEVKLGVGVITLAWFFTTMNSTLVGVFLNNYRLDVSVSAEVIGRLVVLAAVSFMVRLQAPFNFVLLSYFLGNIVNFAINLAIVRKYISLGLAFDFEYWKRAIRQAVPIGMVLVFGFIYFKIDSLMLSWMKGMVDVGIYGTAYKLLEVLQTVPSMFLGVAFPLVTKYVISGDVRVKPAFQKQFDFLALLAVPIVFGTFVLSAPIIHFIAGSRGEEFISASTVTFFNQSATSVTCLRILIISVGISFFSNLYSYMIVSLGRQKSMVLPMISFAAFNVIINLILIPKISYIGASFATLATEILVLAVFYFVSKRYIKLPISISRGLKIFMAGLIMALAAYYLDRAGVGVIFNVVIVAVAYTALIFLFRAVPMDLVKQVMGREKQ